MRISVLLRLAPAAVAANQLAGEAEVVATGERAVVRNAEELLAFISAEAGAAGPAGEPTWARTASQTRRADGDAEPA